MKSQAVEVRNRGAARGLLFYLTILALLSADRISKVLVSHWILPSSTICILPGLFNLTHTLNPGAAFGILARMDPSLRNPFFIGISLLALLFVFCYYHRQGRKSCLSTLGAGMIAGGALGNLWDRICLGAVVDFLDFHVGRYHWPAFNLADSGISLGVGLVIWQIWKEAKS